MTSLHEYFIEIPNLKNQIPRYLESTFEDCNVAKRVPRENRELRNLRQSLIYLIMKNSKNLAAVRLHDRQAELLRADLST